MMEKNLRVQVLRGIAIMAVVLIHTCPRDSAWQIGFRPLVNFGVPMFLFLSGWLTRQKPLSCPTLYKKRITRVLIPYFLWTIVYTLVDEKLRDLPYNILTASAVYTLYYIPVYLQLVLLTPLIKKLAASRFRWAGHLITPVSLLLFSYHPGWLSDRMTLVYYLSFLGWFSYYYLGFLYGDSQALREEYVRWTRYLLPAAILLQIGEAWLWWRAGMADCGTPMKLTALTSNLLLMTAIAPYLGREGAPKTRFLSTFGNYSFGIYLIHPLFIRLFARLPFCLNTLAVLVCSCLSAWLLHLVLKDRASRWLGLI